MNSDDIIKNAKIIQFQNTSYGYKSYDIDDVVKLPLSQLTYKGWALNDHHLTTEYHRKYTLPKLNEIFNFNYNEDDFILKENIINGHDISNLWPKQELIFDVNGFMEEETIINTHFNSLVSCNLTEKNLTDFHKLYRYPHQCSRIINKTITNDRSLFISGDSQMIPNIAILACYFKEVWYFDNRKNGKSLKKEYENKEFSDILIEIGFNNKEKYFKDNLQ